MDATDTNTIANAAAECRERAARLAGDLRAASSEFARLPQLPPGPERDGLVRAITALSAAAMPWLAGCGGTPRRRRKSPGVTADWVGGG